MVQVQDKRTAVPLGHGMRDTEMSTQVQLGRRQIVGGGVGATGPPQDTEHGTEGGVLEGRHIQEGPGNGGWDLNATQKGALGNTPPSF